MTTPRRLALEVLCRVEATASYANLLLDARLKGSGLSAEDRGLATELVYGVLRWRGRLDWELRAACDRPLEALEPVVRNALRLGVYQLRHLSRIPAYAAVDGAVRLVRGAPSDPDLGPIAGSRRAAAYVNGVLRSLARRDPPAFPDPLADPVGYLAAAWSHPAWLAGRWLDRLGLEEAKAVCRANLDPAPVTVAVNNLRCEAEAVEAELASLGAEPEPSRWVPGMYRLGAPRRALASAPMAEGRLLVMDEAAALPVHLLGPRPGERVLDACAGGGAKAALAAGLMAGDPGAARKPDAPGCPAARRPARDRWVPGEIVALDASARALRRLAEARRRLGLDRVIPLQADARRPPRTLHGGFQRVLVDAPCTGLGTLRRHPEIKWRRHPAALAHLPRLQGEILAGAAACVGPGGVLVYATCTVEPAENEEVVEAFLKAHGEFTVEAAPDALPGPARPLVGPDGAIRTYPHRHGIDGFYAVRLRRAGQDAARAAEAARGKH